MDHRTADDTRLGELMRAAQAGDAEAYFLLLQEIAPRVRQIVSRHRGSRVASDLEDLVQDVLLSVHAARASYDPSRPFLPWLVAIARHRVVDGARRFARHAAREVQVEHLDVTFSNAPANTTVGEPDDAGILRQAVQALPVKQREAIELLKLQELSLKEAAATTGMSVGALKVATHRAMATLRRMLIPGDGNGH
jgi:RNA polymerase sigma-70 factor (ECF subfamily)